MQETDRDEAAAPSHERSNELPQVIVVDGTLKALGVGTFLVILVVALYFGRDFLLPVVLAFLFALVLAPVVRSLARRGVPEGVTAILLVVILATTIASALYSLSGPVSQWIEDAPRIGREVQDRIATLRRPVDAVVDASEQVERLAKSEDPEAQRVVLSEPGLM